MRVLQLTATSVQSSMELHHRRWGLGLALVCILAVQGICASASQRTLQSKESHAIVKDGKLESSDGKVYLSVRESPTAFTPAQAGKGCALYLIPVLHSIYT